MSEKASTALTASEATTEVVTRLLELVAYQDVDHALWNLQQMIARLGADAEEDAVARDVLRNTPAEVLREGLRLRAARVEAAQ